MNSKHFLGKTIASVAAALALGVVTLPAHAADTTAEFLRQLDQSDGVKSSDASWTNTAREVSSSPPYNDAVSVPASTTDAARAGRQEQSGDPVMTPGDGTISVPSDSRDNPKYQQ